VRPGGARRTWFGRLIEWLEGPKGVILIGGVFALILALFIQGVLPAMLPETRRETVTRVVRTDLGQLQWVHAKAQPYTPLERLGRRVYQREGCWYCHSQYIRPINDEELRWGPVTEAGEYAFDVPHFWGTQRIGPDLARVGLKVANGWHYAHHWEPQLIVPASNMPAVRWLFRAPVTAELTGEGEARTVADTPDVRALGLDPNGEKVLPLFPGPDGLTFVPVLDAEHGELVDNRGTRPELRFGQNREFKGTRVTLVAPTEEMVGLVAYVQKLGMNRGKWRDAFASQRAFADGNFTVEGRTPQQLAFGRIVYQNRCAGCHGDLGDGWGLASTFFNFQPRDFRAGVFKFRSTPSGSLPTDGDLLRTLTVGVRGTAMPTWHDLPFRERMAALHYIKTFSERWQQELPPPSIGIPAQAPPATPELLARGKDIWVKAKCNQCHGDQGKGDGPSAPDLVDDFGFPILPADLTTGVFKSGTDVRDMFRTISTGLDGTPMPSFADAFPEADDRWALSYYVLSLSAWTDPLYATPEPFPDEVKKALNDPKAAHLTPATAYRWTGPSDRNLPVYQMPSR
jgi:cytochrome c oxidase cbb3-type subunit I/II